MTRVGQRLLLVCAGTLCALVFAEIALRVSLQGPVILHVQWGTPAEEIEYRAGRFSGEQYGTFTYDDSGFRVGSGEPFDRSVLFIGDSFTEGRGVGDDETFARAAERALRRQGVRARSLNAGHRGFGAAQELKVLRRVLARERVDAVVVQSFPMNDLSDNIADGSFGVEDGRLVAYDPPRVPLRGRLARLVRESWLGDLYILRTVANAMLWGDPAAPYDPPGALDLEAALLAEIVATARARGIPVIVLVIPTRLVQQPPDRNHAATPIAELRRFEHVRALVETLGVPWIDAGAVISDLGADAAKGDGGHFSRDGNTLVGEAIARELAPLLLSSGRARSHDLEEP